MENKTFILYYANGVMDEFFGGLMETVLENKSELSEKAELYVKYPDQYHDKIVDWVNDCFDIEYDKYNLLNIIYPVDENTVDFLDPKSDISDELKIKYFLKYWEDISNED